ncbi:RidA family protein [Pelagibius sp. Alg239-R121]|uniref:RidA family protein n=1 Tax=Pelagibius sp. Alg239-R121 TaxID=2993448 RepID=UPI0024A63BE4|nr:Rid family detoxifying hydrolase [Pelagibius sp. Alg239-R121]
MPSKTKIETFRLASLPEEVPFASAVRVKDTVYVSGQIGHRPGEMRLVDGGFEAEATQAMDYMRESLEIAGSSLERVIKCTVYFADIKDFRSFSAIYRRYFPNHLPARSGMEVQGLALGAQIEIECIALVE